MLEREVHRLWTVMCHLWGDTKRTLLPGASSRACFSSLYSVIHPSTRPSTLRFGLTGEATVGEASARNDCGSASGAGLDSASPCAVPETNCANATVLFVLRATGTATVQ
ncbi:unnamed protein product [Pleuronectes platessa]|uniref:Uncharacterized protein n=1 Tax=Pleuronectes platessa TaxID=8262 RepID=A0A9N7U8M2_PLEPL|nr:unnamed protein product [Pleuronectes platessa]